MSDNCAEFCIGQIIRHRLFGYRGVIVDIDPQCMASDEWYEQMAASRPPRDHPWYHVLVDGSNHRTYVAERNMQMDEDGDPVSHPELDEYFSSLENGVYVLRKRAQ